MVVHSIRQLGERCGNLEPAADGGMAGVVTQKIRLLFRRSDNGMLNGWVDGWMATRADVRFG